MKQQFLVPGLIAGGLLLLLAGFFWDRIVPTSAFWGDDQAQEYMSAQSELHAIDAHGPNQEQKLNAARDRFVKIQQQLDSARSSRARSGFLFKLAGISLVVLGVVWHLVASQPGK